jgi:hypothetical protein
MAKKDAAAKAASDLTEAKARRAEEAATMEEAIQCSLCDIVPTENTMPLDMALEWSRREWEQEEREQQRRLLDLAAAQRHAAAVTLPRRGAPPVVKLEESSDDELYRPTPPRFGDAGQGSSRRRRTMTPPTMTTATTRRCTAVSACRLPCLGPAKFEYMTNAAYICKISQISPI